MIKRRFACTQCRREFIVEVFEEGEAQEKRIPTFPVRCPYCGGPVERK